MSESRKIVLVLGNGFDLDLGLKTSYKDFWESEFCPKDYPAPLISHLNERWEDNIDKVRWYDLENELLNYYLSIKDLSHKPDVIDSKELDFIKDINPAYLSFGIKSRHIEAANSLFRKGYIKDNPKKFPAYLMPYHDDMLDSSAWRDKKAFSLIKEALTSYVLKAKEVDCLGNSVAYAVLFAMKTASEYGNNLKIFSFNYTTLPNPYNYSFKDLFYHVHGNCENNSIILGTREFEEEDHEYDYLQKCIDPNHNPPTLEKSLYASNDVIVFGHSLGENDDPYFDDYFKHLLSEQPTDCTLTFFTKDYSSESDLKRSIQRLTCRRLTSLRNKTTVRFYHTDRLYEDPTLFRIFLQEYIKDSRYIDPIILNLKKANSGT